MDLWAAESDERQCAKRGLASNFAAPNVEKRCTVYREIRCLSPVCTSRMLTFNGAVFHTQANSNLPSRDREGAGRRGNLSAH